MVIKDVEKDYNEADAWPVFLDNFVEFMREQNLAKWLYMINITKQNNHFSLL